MSIIAGRNEDGFYLSIDGEYLPLTDAQAEELLAKLQAALAAKPSSADWQQDDFGDWSLFEDKKQTGVVFVNIPIGWKAVYQSNFIGIYRTAEAARAAVEQAVKTARKG